ncbi:MAG: hypothetical protein CVT95_10320 [Bacteroidetes bacterium HGW-Bacteroidetes-12]|nr:MAG: hypothetical protein CVT95_10320 [Bacteroidetes bacterium HGW-Bacteroidetes-12]
MTGKIFLYLFLWVLIISCNSTSTITEINPAIIHHGNNSKSIIVENKKGFIDYYISKIDFKANDADNINIDELEIHGDKRIITSNESEKNIVLKNKSIVRLKYKDHLANNFIKSKVFYYNNDTLICIKIYEILPDEFNKATLYQRAIYFHNNQLISDSDELNQTNKTQSLVVLAQEYLKKEYLSLN